MMSANVDKIVKIYRSLAQIPSLVGAKLGNNQTTVTTIWSQRNLERGKTLKFQKTISISPELTRLSENFPVDITNELLSATSPSEKLRAVLRDLNEKQYLEVWENSVLVRTVDLNGLDLHGNVYTDGEIGTLHWSPDESKIIYLAELKVPKSEPFYKRTGKKEKGDESEKTKGEEYLYRQDWGEQLVGKQKSVIAEYTIESDSVEILPGIPEDICPAQVRYSPDGSYLVGVAYYTEPRKLGLIYCTNRPSTIFKLDFSGGYTTIKLENKSVKSPIFTPDGSALLWLQRNAGGPHAGAMALVKSTVPQLETTSVVLDIVKNKIQTSNGSDFYGLYNSGFVKNCYASGNRLIVSTNQGNTINTYVIDLETGRITELPYSEGSQIVFDVVQDLVLVNRRNFFKRDLLAIGKLPEKGSEDKIKFTELTSTQITKGLENCTYEYLDLTQNNDEAVRNFTAIYLGPTSGESKSVPLILWPHGGPHSAFANNLSLEASLFMSLGYAVILINFRGSIGAGQDSVDFLPGKIGKADVADCILALQATLAKYEFLNPSKLALVGGSHGGFLVTHLSGQYPDTFKAVIARNPVIDVASMSIISDIPDWCYVEAGYEYTQKGQINSETLLEMRNASPIMHAHKVKAATLLQIGSKDLRVPPHQGLEFYTRLKANGTTVRLNLYDDNHPLGTVPNEMDNLINTILWLQKHVTD